MRASPWLAPAVLAATMSLAAGAGDREAATPQPLRARELVVLVQRDCGACHGLNLTGGLGPALTPAALGGKPVESLVATIVAGRPGTPMPPWGRFMSEEEARWIVARLVSGDLDAR